MTISLGKNLIMKDHTQKECSELRVLSKMVLVPSAPKHRALPIRKLLNVVLCSKLPPNLAQTLQIPGAGGWPLWTCRHKNKMNVVERKKRVEVRQNGEIVS